MGLKEQLIKNKEDNEEVKFYISEYQSSLSYRLGENDTPSQDVDWSRFFDPYIKLYSDLKLKLDNGSSENPLRDRKITDDILQSVSTIQQSMENIASNTEIWGNMVQISSIMGGLDMMSTPVSRFIALSILNDDLKGKIDLEAVDGDINNLAWLIYDENGIFVERLLVNKINTLSETQDMFITIPDTSKENQEFKQTNPEIFEQKPTSSPDEPGVLTGGVTETYRVKDKTGKVKLISKDISSNMVQDFYEIDRETIGKSLAFTLTMDKISAGLIGAYQSSDQVIAFNNNILAEVTDFYLKPGIALKENQKDKFQKDYQKWYLEKEIGKEFPSGEPRLKEQPKEEIVEEEVVEEEVVS
jgi:hypothetical protein|tara:strand:+ start:303 stop:1373 length:1071 start_codon:yes stop_codon:yes gene_type:complete